MGYDITRFQGEIHEDFICPICSDVLEEPLQAPQCEHAFCKSCISEWLKRQPSCPIDRQPVSELKPVPRILRNLLSELLILCDNATFGCTVRVKLERLDVHLEECEYDPKRRIPHAPMCGLVELKRGDSEEEFERYFQDWEKQVEAWKKKYQHHPDKGTYVQYVKLWQEYRVELLQKKEQMQKEKSQQMAAASPVVQSSSTTGNITSVVNTQTSSTTVTNTDAATSTSATMSYQRPQYMQRYMNPGATAVMSTAPVLPAGSPVGNYSFQSSDDSISRDASSEDSDSDSDSDGPVSTELENARLQTEGDEELQLHLALAMSIEEAERKEDLHLQLALAMSNREAEEERLPRNDDLRLQMALTESLENYQGSKSNDKDNSIQRITPSPNRVLSLLKKTSGARNHNRDSNHSLKNMTKIPETSLAPNSNLVNSDVLVSSQGSNRELGFGNPVGTLPAVNNPNQALRLPPHTVNQPGVQVPVIPPRPSRVVPSEPGCGNPLGTPSAVNNPYQAMSLPPHTINQPRAQRPEVPPKPSRLVPPDNSMCRTSNPLIAELKKSLKARNHNRENNHS